MGTLILLVASIMVLGLLWMIYDLIKAPIVNDEENLCNAVLKEAEDDETTALQSLESKDPNILPDGIISRVSDSLDKG